VEIEGDWEAPCERLSVIEDVLESDVETDADADAETDAESDVETDADAETDAPTDVEPDVETETEMEDEDEFEAADDGVTDGLAETAINGTVLEISPVLRFTEWVAVAVRNCPTEQERGGRMTVKPLPAAATKFGEERYCRA